jgi:hypothetical protein
MFLSCLVAASLLLCLFSVAVVKADTETVSTPKIYIQPDGAVDPATSPIQRSGNVYTFTSNVSLNGDVVVQRNNVVLNGNGYMLENGRIFLSNQNNVTVENFYIQHEYASFNFTEGIYVNDSSAVTVSNNTIFGTTSYSGAIAILGGLGNVVVGNTLAGNHLGLSLYDYNNHTILGIATYTSDPAPMSLLVYDNNFGNDFQYVAFYSIDQTDAQGNEITQNSTIRFDNGTVGNYWRNYNGTDSNGDGIGDTPYPVYNVFAIGGYGWYGDRLSYKFQDNYPLMQPYNTPKIEVPDVPNVLLLAMFVPLVVAALVFLRRKLEQPKRNVQPTRFSASATKIPSSIQP